MKVLTATILKNLRRSLQLHRYQKLAHVVTTSIDIEKFQLTANGPIETTSELKIRNTLTEPKWPVYRVLNPDGTVASGATVPVISKETALRMYHTMCSVQTVDDIFYNAQRQGRISFYMQNSGYSIIYNISGERV